MYHQWRAEEGGAGGDGPRAQALERADIKSRAFKGPAFPALGGLPFLFLVEDLFFFFFFCLSIFYPGPKGLFLPKGGAKGGGGASRVGLWGC